MGDEKIAERLARRFLAVPFAPFIDPVTKDTGFAVQLGTTDSGQRASATVTKLTDAKWVARITVGGTSISTGEGAVPVQAVQKAHDELVRLISPLNHLRLR